MLAKSKLYSIETLVSQALIAMEISHGELNAIIRDKQKYERIKEIVTNVFQKQKKYETEQCEFENNNELVNNLYDWQFRVVERCVRIK